MDNLRRVYNGRGAAARAQWLALALALLFLVGHLPFLAPDLDDIDPVNFALGVRQFDPTLHRPHPPGYPVFIALAKLTTWTLQAFESPAAGGVGRGEASGGAEGQAGSAPARQREAAALAFLSALFGALACFPMIRLFDLLAWRERDQERQGFTATSGVTWTSVAATLVAATCPLYWFTGSRPLSDLPGLTTGLVAQALLAEAFLGRRPLTSGGASSAAVLTGSAARAETNGLIVAGAFVAGIAIGFRSQTIWLTLPLLGLVLFDRIGRGALGALLRGTVSFVVGVVLWGIPLIIASGGPTRYLRAVFAQGTEDLAGVDMGFNNPTPRRMALGLYHTFVLPWASVPVAAVVLTLALIGLFGLLLRSKRGLLVVLAAAGPYAIFHLLFHETVTTRYALPLVPITALLAMCGIWTLLDAALLAWRAAAPESARSEFTWRPIAGRVGVGLAGAALAFAGLAVSAPAVIAYAASGSPIFRAIEDMRRSAAGLSSPPTLAMHRRVMNESRRAMTWAAQDRPFWARTLPATASHESIEVVKFWREGRDEPVWFLADPLRTDLALIDPAARRHLVRYRWPFLRTDTYVGGARPWEMDWYDIRSPGWFAGEGWALTPETAGTAARDRKGPGLAPIDAWVRRRPGPATLMLGGRNLGRPEDPRARIIVTLDGREIDRVSAAPAPGFFLRMVSLRAGTLSGAGPHALLQVSASREDGRPGPVNVGIEQFDIQDEALPILGYDAGWHELEYNPRQGRLWRWTSEAATLRVHAGACDMALVVSGESPLKYFPAVPVVTVRAATATLGRFEPSADFTFSVPLPVAAVEQAGEIITIETSRTFVPDERTHNGDRRRLGLRVYSVTLEPAAR